MPLLTVFVIAVFVGVSFLVSGIAVRYDCKLGIKAACAEIERSYQEKKP